MKKAILVDDEVFARKGLIGLIPWEKLGFEVAGEAEDGEDACALIEAVRPDVVITDIRMPVLDGLELIRKVRESGNDKTKFIIISGYGDFKYAQQAVRYGVADYLLKPIDENELIDALRLIREQLEKDQPRSEAGDALLQASLFEKLLSGRAEAESLRAAMDTFRLREGSPFRYFAVELNDLPAGMGDAERIERAEQAKRAIARTLARTTSSSVPYVHLRGEFELGFVWQIDGNAREQARIGEELARVCAAIAGTVPKIYIGDAVMEVGQVRKSYLSASEAMKHKYAQDERNVILSEEVRKNVLVYKEIDSALYAELMERLEENDLDGMKAIADKAFKEFREQGMAPESIRDAMSRIAHGASRIVQTMNGDPKKLATLPSMLDWAERPRTLKGLRELLHDFLSECAGCISELRSTVCKGDIGKIKAFIENHYNENISLKSIAKRFYMNPVYLGQLFKKTYGTYFNDYLLQIRIREAKRQLRQTDKKVYEIAASVGFSNADYFVTQFEKVERKTPTEYKNALLEKI